VQGVKEVIAVEVDDIAEGVTTASRDLGSCLQERTIGMPGTLQVVCRHMNENIAKQVK